MIISETQQKKLDDYGYYVSYDLDVMYVTNGEVKIYMYNQLEFDVWVSMKCRIIVSPDQAEKIRGFGWRMDPNIAFVQKNSVRVTWKNQVEFDSWCQELGIQVTEEQEQKIRSCGYHVEYENCHILLVKPDFRWHFREQWNFNEFVKREFSNISISPEQEKKLEAAGWRMVNPIRAEWKHGYIDFEDQKEFDTWVEGFEEKFPNLRGLLPDGVLVFAGTLTKPLELLVVPEDYTLKQFIRRQGFKKKTTYVNGIRRRGSYELETGDIITSVSGG